jgi:Fe-S-cluster-containing hydrogenase component 2
MQNCPTQAIRVIDGKAKIISEKCIDCGKCITVCPYNAKAALADQLSDLEGFDYTVALPSLSFYAQFSEMHSKNKIHSAIESLGFNEVFDTSHYAEVISVYLKDLTEDPDVLKPIISTYCPAVTRLIQIKNPELIKHIAKLESPMEVAAKFVRLRIAQEKQIPAERIGIFLLSQCPAKITSIKKPIGIEQSSLNGAISLQKVFPAIIKRLISETPDPEDHTEHRCLGELWGRIGGQSEVANIRKAIKVDGIDEVSKILDMVELGKLDTLDFIEAYSCTGGCVGGPLNIENPFIAKYRIEKRSVDCVPLDESEIRQEFAYEDLCWDQEIKPSKILQLDENMSAALEKMDRINHLLEELPRINCGACGSPSCRALAEDIVQDRAVLTDCIFKRLRSEYDEYQ